MVECRTTNADGWGSISGTNVCAPANPAVNGYLGQSVALGTVEVVGRDAGHITPLLTEVMETAACSTTLACPIGMRRTHDRTTFTFMN